MARKTDRTAGQALHREAVEHGQVAPHFGTHRLDAREVVAILAIEGVVEPERDGVQLRVVHEAQAGAERRDDVTRRGILEVTQALL